MTYPSLQIIHKLLTDACAAQDAVSAEASAKLDEIYPPGKDFPEWLARDKVAHQAYQRQMKLHTALHEFETHEWS